jgi:prepilin-type N-terminal cleavage/methylation domain-containing protein
MKPMLHGWFVQRRTAAGMTLMEVLIAMGIGSVVLAIIGLLMMYGTRSFVSLGNYSILNEQSHAGIDRITRELREASAVVAWSTNSLPKWILVTNIIVAPNGVTNAYSVKYSWDSDRQLVSRKSTDSADTVLLEGCDEWAFTLWKRFPDSGATNGFYLATNAADCKMITMKWRCSRLIAGMNAVNTEAEQYAQIVLRNKQ